MRWEQCAVGMECWQQHHLQPSNFKYMDMASRSTCTSFSPLSLYTTRLLSKEKNVMPRLERCSELHRTQLVTIFSLIISLPL